MCRVYLMRACTCREGDQSSQYYQCTANQKLLLSVFVLAKYPSHEQAKGVPGGVKKYERDQL